MLPFARVTIIGLGLIGSSVARAVKAQMPGVRVIGHDADADVRARAVSLGICDDVTDTAGAAVRSVTRRRHKSLPSRGIRSVFIAFSCSGLRPAERFHPPYYRASSPKCSRSLNKAL